LPGLLFGALSIGSGLLTFFLPETLNRPLPQTIEDIENWSKKPAGRGDSSEPAAAQHEMSAVEGKDSVHGGNAAPANAI